MRERLIEIMKKCDITKIPTETFIEGYADYLLANGVIVPLCKVGQTLYSIKKFKSAKRKTVYSFTAPDMAWIIEHTSAFGKTIFLTPDAAEKALEGIYNECL